MGLFRKPVAGQSSSISPQDEVRSKPTVRIVPSEVEPKNGSRTAMDDSNADSIAPALALMEIYDRADSVLGHDDDSLPSKCSAKSEKLAKSRLQKPLPRTPSHESFASARGSLHDDAIPFDPRTQIVRTNSESRELEKQLGVAGVLDLSSTEDTTYEQHYAPAVVHEIIREDVHEIYQEVITREIHNHYVYHRTLPVHEIEILPSRHFLEDASGSRQEIPAAAVPGWSEEHLSQIFAEVFRHRLPKSSGTTAPRVFTAREFPGTEGDYKETIEPSGFVRTEQWWVHPPTLEPATFRDGEAYVVHFDD